MTNNAPAANPFGATEPHLRRRRFGLRFERPDTEAAFRAWYRQSTLPHLRAGLILGAVALLSFVVTQLAAFVPGTEAQLAVEVLVLLPLLAVSLFLTLRPRLAVWASPLTGLNNVLFGLTLAWIGSKPVFRLEYVVPLVIVCAYFHLTIVRVPPLQGLIAVTAYYLPVQVGIAWAGMTGAVDPLLAAYFSVALVTSLTSGMGASLLLYRLSGDTYVQEQTIAAQRSALELEKQRSDSLLASILPAPIAERLKTAPEMIAEHHAEVTVLFADIVGFTPMAAALAPERLVERLNQIFSRFDELAAALEVERVKTIGDAYMAVAGAPVACADHAPRMAELALGIRDAVAGLQFEQPIAIRIGLHSGPAVAGVIGTRRFAYDLWGDTVNMAARMESHGLRGEIQVSDATRALLGDRYLLEDRGSVDIKGKGAMRTWILTARAVAERP